MTMQIYPDLIPIFLQRINGFCAFLTHSFAKLHLINFVWNFDYNFRRFERNYRKNYRKPIYRHLSNYRQNYRYRSKTSTNYRRFQEIIGKVIDIENDRRIIENLSLSKKMTYRPPLIVGAPPVRRGGRYIDEKLSKADKLVFLKLSAIYRYRKMEILKLSKNYRYRKMHQILADK